MRRSSRTKCLSCWMRIYMGLRHVCWNKLANKQNSKNHTSIYNATKRNMPSGKTKDNFFSTQTTSSSSMLPFITQSSMQSSISLNIHAFNESGRKLDRNSRYRGFNDKQCSSNTKMTNVTSQTILPPLLRTKQFGPC